MAIRLAMTPEIIKESRATNRYAPIPVKSVFVLHAYAVSPGPESGRRVKRLQQDRQTRRMCERPVVDAFGTTRIWMDLVVVDQIGSPTSTVRNVLW